ncbi:MAG: T9SS type A sorting domain-containing protein, partial [bacterium]|nr:T9SS type A sorting domain-containing protein [Candidatus Kapabacteria bacterium]
LDGVIVAQTVANIDNPSPGSSPDNILITDDGWRTHTSVALPLNTGDATSVILPAPGIVLVHAKNLLTQKPHLFRSTDKGSTWTRSDALPNVVAFSFPTALHGWAAGSRDLGIGTMTNDLVTKTTDGGLTWIVVLDSAIGSRTLGLNAIDFSDGLNGIAVGQLDKILRTRDGGATWQQEFVPYNVGNAHGLRAVTYPRNDLAIIISRLGPIFRYDGTQTLASPTFTAPTGHGARPIDSVMIEWTPIVGAETYRVQVAHKPLSQTTYDSQIFSRSYIDTVLSGTQLELRDLKYGHLYFGRVKSMNDVQESQWYENEGSGIFHTMRQGEVLAPTIQSPAQLSTNQPVDLTVAWTPVNGATSYDLQIGTDRSYFDPLTFADSLLVNNQHFVSGLSFGTEYYVRVRARLASGVTQWSSRTEPHLFRTWDGMSSVQLESPGLRALRDGSTLSVYPNPTRGDQLLVVRDGVGDSGAVEIELLSSLAVCVARAKMSGRQAMFDVGDLPSGLYFVRVRSGGSASSVVINR